MQRHPLDLLSLLFGLVFTAVAVIGLTDLLTLTVIDVRWIGPGLLVAFGVTLVLTAGRSREPQGAAGGPGSGRPGLGRPGTGAARPTGPAGHAVGDPESAVGDREGPADEPAGDVAADAADGAAADPADGVAADPATGVAADPADDPPDASRDG